MTEGKEEFEKRVAAARDFFDYWIEREAASTDLDSLGAKMQLARKLAETVARVHDPLMRGEVVSKVSARLGVSRFRFRALPAETSREPSCPTDDPGCEADARAASRGRACFACSLCAMRKRAIFCWRRIGAKCWRRRRDAEIARPDSRERSASRTIRRRSMRSCPRLSTGEEALVSSWLLQKMPANGLEVAEGWWNGLRQAGLRRQLQMAEGRMKLPRLTTGEVVNLQKQILDLTEQLHELSEFSSARVLDT